MPDENRFAGLSDAVGGEGEDDGTETEDDVAGGERPDAENETEPEQGVNNPGATESVDSSQSSNIGQSSNIVDGVKRSESEQTPEPSVDVERESLSAVIEDVKESAGNDGDPSVATPTGDGASDPTETSTNIVKSSNIVDGEKVADPAFEFDETAQHSVYVRPSTWQRLEDLESLVDARLRTDHDIRNVTGSEFHDAVLRVAAEHEDELIGAILAARRTHEKMD